MRRSILSVFLALVLVSGMAMTANARVYLGALAAQEMTENGRIWYGGTIRSLGGLLGLEFEGRFTAEDSDDSETTIQFTPWVLLNIGTSRVNLYGGAAPVIISENGGQQFRIQDDAIYTKAGLQYNTGLISVFGQGVLQLSKTEADNPPYSLEIGVALGL